MKPIIFMILLVGTNVFAEPNPYGKFKECEAGSAVCVSSGVSSPDRTVYYVTQMRIQGGELLPVNDQEGPAIDYDSGEVSVANGSFVLGTIPQTKNSQNVYLWDLPLREGVEYTSTSKKVTTKSCGTNPVLGRVTNYRKKRIHTLTFTDGTNQNGVVTLSEDLGKSWQLPGCRE